MPATEQTWRDQKLLHKVFAVTAILMLVATIWMFAKDNNREWKGYQRNFRHMEVVNTEWQQVYAAANQNKVQAEELHAQLRVAATSRPDVRYLEEFKQAVRLDLESCARLASGEAASQNVEKEVAAAHKKIDDAFNAIPVRPAEFATAEAEKQWELGAQQKREDFLNVLARFVADTRFREESYLDLRKMKASEFDAVKSDLDIAIRDSLPLPPVQQRVDQVKEELAELNRAYETAADSRLKQQAIIDEITEPVRNLNKLIADNQAELDRLKDTYQERIATWFSGDAPFLGKKWLELPILDAFNSPLKVDNLWTDGLTHKMYNFKPVLRYDRCTTCHRGMEKTQPGSSTEPMYELAHELTFTLRIPAKPAPVDGVEPKLTLDSVYGLQLAGEGMLNADDVTINFVRDASPAATAPMLLNEAARQLMARDVLESSLSAVRPVDAPSPLFGLQMGDVFIEIDGDTILSKDQVQRKLLDTVGWGKDLIVKVRRGYPHPYATHPRLDLFVGSTSPHQLQTMGCTVCHEGQGSATSFKWASHMPDNMKQRDEWMKKYGWFDNHHWIYPMYPDRFIEASCLKCHHDVVDLQPSQRFPEPPAPKVVDGYDTIRNYGCFGCHEVNGFNGPEVRVGPDMRLEPNYFAAGLQLAFVADQRLQAFAERRQQLEAQVASLPEDQKTKAEETLAIIQAYVGNNPQTPGILNEIRELGLKLASNPQATSTRDRLRELVDNDQSQFDEFQAAVARGEQDIDSYVSALPREAYEMSMVLKNDETPGTFRKVGPSLRFVAEKLDAPFLSDWIRNPRHFRPSTKMPQFFQLWDHLSDAEAAHTAQLEDVEIEGLTAFLLHFSQPFTPVVGQEAMELAAKPGDGERGKVLFEVGGCLACHSNKDFPGQGTQGPDLTGAGDKFPGDKGRDWLYGWIENPKRYHARTKMPVVPLKPLAGNEETDPIADVVAYLQASKIDWKPVDPDGQVDAKALDALAMEYLTKTFYKAEALEYLERGIPESRRSMLKGAEVELLMSEESIAQKKPLSQEQKLLYIGRQTISKYGCFGCHDVPGFENAKPIGTALTDWGRKDAARLAFEHIDHYVHDPSHGGGHGNAAHAKDADAADTHGHAAGPSHAAAGHEHVAEGEMHDSLPGPVRVDQVTHHEQIDSYFSHQLHHHNRTGFIWQKLREPRSYDFGKVENKGFNERLRMPQFTFNYVSGDSPEENAARNAKAREGVITFVLGLVADPPVNQFVYHPEPRARAIIEGRKVLDKFNCAGCHELDSEQWDFAFPSDWAELSEPSAPQTFPFLIPHISTDQIQRSELTQRNGMRSASITGKPQVNAKGHLIPYAYEPADEMFLPLDEFDQDEFAPVNLAYRFELWKPSVISGYLFMPKDSLPAIPLRQMTQRIAPNGGDLSSYLLPRVLDITGQDKGAEAWGWVPPSLVGEGRKVQPQWLHSFLLDPHPIRPAVMLNMPKFNMSDADATALVNYFAAKDGADYPYEFESIKRTSHLEQVAVAYERRVGELPPAERERFSGNRFNDVMKIVTSKAGCVKCHNVGDYVSTGDPRSKGPNLNEVHARLRPDYVRNWIAKPNYILPYTSMPELIKYSPENPQQDGFYDALPDMSLVPVYHGSSVEQLDALVDLLMNIDRFHQGRSSIAELVPEGEPPAEVPPGDAPAAEEAAGE